METSETKDKEKAGQLDHSLHPENRLVSTHTRDTNVGNK